MTEDIDRRTKEREEKLRSALGEQRRLARPEDYLFDKSQEKFWDVQDNTLNGAVSVDASIPVELWRVEVEEGDEGADPDAPRKRGRPRKRKEKLINPSRDIMRVENDQFVEGATWWPGQEKIVHDWFVDGSGFFPAPGRRVFNHFRPAPDPRSLGGVAGRASVWVEHVKRLWPDPKEHEYFFDYCAHMVQRPEEKCNAAIILSGTQGIGKDAALLPVKVAIGIWNSVGIDPDQLFSDFAPWKQTLMLVVDEVRPTKDDHQASSMYNILKPLTAAPPHTLPLNDKREKLRYIINLMRVFLTTNDWMAMYIPPEDRRMFVMHSTLDAGWHLAAGLPNYFEDLFAWFEDGGDAHVAAWLAGRDISAFSAKAPVHKTAGWNAVATTWDSNDGDDPVGLAIEALGKPGVFFSAELLGAAPFDAQDDMAVFLRSKRKAGLRMQKAGYMPMKAVDGNERWTYNGEKQFRSKFVYVRADLMTRMPPEELRRMIDERGNSIAAGRKPSPFQVVAKKPAQDKPEAAEGF